MSTAFETGKLGEDHTARYLEEQGFSLLARNFKRAGGEIDLIAAGNGFILFVEVKTRGQAPLYAPAFAVTKAKQRRILQTARHYLAEVGSELQPRFDVAQVTAEDGQVLEFEYLENAFWE